jgi:hypothetical protein
MNFAPFTFRLANRELTFSGSCLKSSLIHTLPDALIAPSQCLFHGDHKNSNQTARSALA